MAVISWGTIKSLLIFFGPMLVPKAITWYRSIKNRPRERNKPIVPLPNRALVAILVLAAAAVLFLLCLSPLTSPENIFVVTRSNPTVSSGLLMSQLSMKRPLTARDEVLRTRLESKAGKLLYYKYGPDVLADCPFCNSQDPTTYLLYAAPSVVTPHLLNAALVGLATSELLLKGRAASQWRRLATYAVVVLAAVDAGLLVQWDHVDGNERARMLREVVFFYWRARVVRYAALACLDLALAAVLYLSATNRLFVPDMTVAERIDIMRDAVGAATMRIRSANVLKNTVARDAELRAADAGYWAHEGVLMQEAMESQEVVDSMRDAVENRRIDLQTMEQVAESFAQRMMGGTEMAS
ncbi:hypothetical protein M406DRAFT_356079 [Cryphonectria parasitica EP155]|uniref:Uncharacterized protein n=1 Tax=Cryphonectria parasitica (strain ATCC 38755 / EP155) TaxID=660469 RepID=A0A9P4Y3H1_CRYP1|nr:uncharacterized protein M406DRAFT_356079 [Cryphonectria parasitica EP155]KAF3765836.1 hypothetical protein M406DRAFT_356079 [Cryphonectria parasitica EP155]